jgi:2-phospho-L-lactate guanylyltransferase
MALRVIIPVKPFAEAKQRLAPVLNPAKRAQLAEQMFRHVLATASAFATSGNILVVSRSQEVLAIAEADGALTLPEGSDSDLNSALTEAAAFAAARGDSKVLIVASDLPLLEVDDLAAMTAHECAIAPDWHARGTNALLWPVHLGFRFGQDSYARHRTIAESAGFQPEIVERPGLAHDVDEPEDLFTLLPEFFLSPGTGGEG